MSDANAVRLLPPNASAQERAMAGSAARLSDIPVPVDRLWNPETCPVEVLPWLAWALSVDVWDAAWPEAVKRAVIADSIRVHRVKGTRGAVTRALAALGLSAEITEWWEEEPPGAPYTFTVTALVNDNLGPDALALDLARQKAVVDTIARAKNARSHFAVRYGAVIGQGLTLAATAQTLSRFVGRGAALVSYAGQTVMGIAAAAHNGTRLAASGVARTRDHFTGTAGLTAQAYQAPRLCVTFKE